MIRHTPSAALVELMLKDQAAVPPAAQPSTELPPEPLRPLGFVIPKPDWRAIEAQERAEERAAAARHAAAAAQAALEPDPPARPRKWSWQR